MATIYLLLGGNIGDKERIFEEAGKYLDTLIGEISQKSAIYETEPWGFESSDLFWNQALEISTRLSPEEVLAQIHVVEKQLGRIRKVSQYGSRTIDIDILFYDNQIVNNTKLTIPHPRLQERNFALIPLCEIAPGLIHPVFQKSISQLLAESKDMLIVRKAADLKGTS